MCSPCSVSDYWSRPRPKIKCKRCKCRWCSCCRAFSFPDSSSRAKQCRGFSRRSAHFCLRLISSHSRAPSFSAARTCSNTGRSCLFSLSCRSCSSPSARSSSAKRSAELWRQRVGCNKGSVVRVFEHRFELLAQFLWIFVTVRRGRVLHRGVEHFFFGARNSQSATLIAWIIPTIDRFTFCHTNLLSFSSVPPNPSTPDRCARLVLRRCKLS